MRVCTLLLLAVVALLSGCQTGEVAPPPKLTDIPLDEVLERDLSQVELQQVFANQFKVRNAEGRLHAALDILPICVDRLSADAAYKTVGSFLAQLLRARQYDDLQRTVDYVRNMFPNRAGLQELCTTTEIEYLQATRRFDKAVTLLTTESRELSDANMARVTRRLLARSRSKANLVASERLCEFVISKSQGKRRTLDAVAGRWVSLAQKQGKFDQIPLRLSRLLAAGAAPSVVSRAYTSAGNAVLQKSDKAMLRQMMQIGQSLSSRLRNRDDRNDIARLMLDYSCILEDFGASLHLLRICYQDDLEGEEYERMRNKVLAHKALKDGRLDEAVRRFRAFMESAKTWKTDQYDPSTGETVPVDAILGLNARRIGDILTKAGDKKAAAAAYVEAKTYYRAAGSKVKEGTIWKANVEKALKELSSP
ncbi:hypothetical protein ACFLQU_00395 [Verrucomicrobiota bacterium]